MLTNRAVEQNKTLNGPWVRGISPVVRHKIYKNSDLCWCRNGHRSTNHVHRTMDILDVISRISRSSKCNKIISRLGPCLRPHWGSSQLSHRPLAVFKGVYFKVATSKGSGREGREGERWQNDLCSRAPETLALPLLVWGRAGGPETLVRGGPPIWSYAAVRKKYSFELDDRSRRGHV